MKRSVLLAVMAVVLLPGIAICEGKGKSPKVFRDGGTISDPVFRQYVLDNFDTDRDGRISQSEADAVTEIIELPLGDWDDDLERRSPTIFSLEGIQYFKNLLALDCSDCEIATLDLSQNTKLKKLNCARNNLTNLNLSQNKELEELECGSNNLTRLDLSQNFKLKKLITGDINEDGYYKNDLSEIILPHTGVLKEVEYGGHKFSSLNFSGQSQLETIICTNCGLTSLNLDNCKSLKKLSCNYNELAQLDLGDCRELKYLNCSNNKLTQLDLSDIPTLEFLDCGNNKLTSLNVTCCLRLATLKCYQNKISKLDLKNTPQLKTLNCNETQLDALDISCCPEIENVFADLNPWLRAFNLSETKLDMLQINPYMVTQWKYTGATAPKTVFRDDHGTFLYYQDIIQVINEIESDTKAYKVSTEQRRAESQRKAAEYKRQIMPYITRNDWEGADKFAAEALAELPDGDAFLYCVRAKAYYLHNLDFEVGDDENMTDYFRAYRSEAEHLVELCRKSIACDPSDGNEAYFYRGLAYVVLGRANDAASDFKSCARGNEPFKASCYYNTGIAYKNAGWHSSALDQFKLARQYYTASDKKEKCLQRIKECQQKISGK